MSEELLPCPYCGGIDIYFDAMQGSMMCRNCWAQGPSETGLDVHDENKLAIAAWNRRPDKPCCAKALPSDKVHHLMAMLLRLGLVEELWFETWHGELYRSFKARAAQAGEAL